MMSIHLVFPGILLTLLVPFISADQVSLLGPKELDGALREIEDVALTARKTLKELTQDKPDAPPVIYEGLVGLKRRKRGVVELLGLGDPSIVDELVKREQAPVEIVPQADSWRSKRKKSKKKKKKSQKKKRKSKKRKKNKKKRGRKGSKTGKQHYGEISYDPRRNRFEFRKIRGYVRPWEKVLGRRP